MSDFSRENSLYDQAGEGSVRTFRHVVDDASDPQAVLLARQDVLEQGALARSEET